MATFSKFPIVRKGETDFNRSLNGSIYSDIVKDADTFRIFNCHLQSIRLRKEYNKLLDSLVFNYSDRQLNEIKDISLRIREAFIQRAEQVNILSQQIRLSPFPVIVCGDFNDTPVSYTYKRLSRGLKDAFIESGSGVGNTYRGNVSFIRIDYVLYSRPFRSRKYSAEKINWSDHYPVKVDFTISETADSTGRHSRH
jgi:endonuclease/exonuclease/phosphatase (EEP) superfamily protein YafD